MHKVMDIHETKWACYDDHGFVEMRHFIADYHTIWKLLIITESQLDDARHEIALWKLRTKGLKTDNRAERRRGDEWKAVGLTERKLRLDNEQRQHRVAWIPWGLMVVQGVLYAGIAVWGVAAR